MSGATEDLDIRDITDRWPVTVVRRPGRGQPGTPRAGTRCACPTRRAVARDIVEHPGAVAVLALDEAGRVLLIRQYRHPVGRQLWEIPAGLRDVAGRAAPGHRPARAARGGRVPGGGLARARRLLPLAGHQHRAGQDLPGPGPERGPGLRALVRSGPRGGPPAGGLGGPGRAGGPVLAGELHNGVTALGILSAYAARQGGFTALRDAEAPEC